MSTQNERELARYRLAQALGDAYDCNRVWEAWSYGTMSQDDFSMVAEDDDRLDEIVEAVCAPLLSRIAELESRIDKFSKDAKRLDWLDSNNKPYSMGWRVSIAPAGNVSITSVISIGRERVSIRSAIDSAISEKGGE